MSKWAFFNGFAKCEASLQPYKGLQREKQNRYTSLKRQGDTNGNQRKKRQNGCSCM